MQDEAEYKSVVENHRLLNGLLFGLPVVFDTDREDIVPGQSLLLMQVRPSLRHASPIGSCLATR